jgi:hypothetical protein
MGSDGDTIWSPEALSEPRLQFGSLGSESPWDGIDLAAPFMIRRAINRASRRSGSGEALVSPCECTLGLADLFVVMYIKLALCYNHVNGY